jgi:hypothetical protein
MSSIVDAGVTVASLIIGVAALSVLVSSKANTTGVIQSAASGFVNSLGVAESPVTGTTMTINSSYPAAMNGSMGLPNTTLGSPSLNT